MTPSDVHTIESRAKAAPLPCPFCGATPAPPFVNRQHGDVLYVVCATAGCAARPFAFPLDGWNTRATLRAHEARIAELVKVLREVQASEWVTGTLEARIAAVLG